MSRSTATKTTTNTAIYWAWIRFDQIVHGGPLGFTRNAMAFCMADNEEAAAKKVIQHFNTKYGLFISKMEVKKAHEQNIDRYVFPGAIIR